MSLDSNIQAASEAAERWVKRLPRIADTASRCNMEEAYNITRQMDAEVAKYAGVFLLEAEQDVFAVVSEGVVGHDGFDGLEFYASAHEAIADIAVTAMLGLLGPQRIEKKRSREEWERLTLSSAKSSELHARIRLERAKLLATVGQSDEYVPFTKLWQRDFANLQAAKRFLKGEGKEIRRRKPSAQRLEVHAGDWARAQIKREETREAVADEADRLVTAREAENERRR